MNSRHPLLRRQLRRLQGDGQELPEEWEEFLEIVSDSYHQADVDRRMLERSLQLSSEELLQASSDVRALLSALPDLTVRLGEDGRVLDILSDGASVLANLKIGHPLDAAFAPQNREEITAALERARGCEEPVTVLVDYDQAGELHKCEIRFRYALDGQFLALIRDITDLVRSKSELEKSLALLRGTLESTDEGFLVADTSGNVVMFNEKLLDIFDLPSSTPSNDLIRQLVDRVTTEAEHHEFLLDQLARVAGRIDVREDFTFELRSGRTVRCSLRPQVIHASVSGQLWCFRDVTERTRNEQAMRHQALHDSLTDLGNRAQFYKRMPEMLLESSRQETSAALLYIDLDRFKSINDSLGHGAGDYLLCQVAERLSENVREDDLLCRLGGDEFTVVVPGLRRPEDSGAVAGHLQEAVNGTYELNGQSIYVSGSIGVAVYPQDADCMTELVRRADSALYRAKANGRSRYCLSHEEGQSEDFDALVLENQMRLSIEREEFAVHYQPQLDMRTGEVVGLEALVRWPQPDGSLLSPARFIPLAEESGLIVPLGYWILNRAIEDTEALRDRYPELRVSVNLSPRQLMDERLASNVEALLTIHAIRRKNLVLELTENGILPNPDQAHRMLKSFRELGVRVALDDFGTGQSSLSHLSLLPIDVVKIDRSFVKDCWSVEASGAIVTAILSICQTRRLSVVAEGIETEKEEEFLLDHDCVFGQGFRYHRPAPIEEVERYIAEKGAVSYQPEGLLCRVVGSAALSCCTDLLPWGCGLA